MVRMMVRIAESPMVTGKNAPHHLKACKDKPYPVVEGKPHFHKASLYPSRSI
jgi:hypothetical protein